MKKILLIACGFTIGFLYFTTRGNALFAEFLGFTNTVAHNLVSK